MGITWSLDNLRDDLALFQMNLFECNLSACKWIFEIDAIRKLETIYFANVASTRLERLQQALCLIPIYPFVSV